VFVLLSSNGALWCSSRQPRQSARVGEAEQDRQTGQAGQSALGSSPGGEKGEDAIGVQVQAEAAAQIVVPTDSSELLPSNVRISPQDDERAHQEQGSSEQGKEQGDSDRGGGCSQVAALTAEQWSKDRVEWKDVCDAVFVVTTYLLVAGVGTSPALLVQGSEVKANGITYTFPAMVWGASHLLTLTYWWARGVQRLESALGWRNVHRELYSALLTLFLLLFLFSPKGWLPFVAGTFFLSAVFSGTVEVGRGQEVVVALPSSFESKMSQRVGRFDTSFFYQLTPVGDSMPGLHVRKEISPSVDTLREKKNFSFSPPCSFSFVIGGAKAHCKVSWSVQCTFTKRLSSSDKEKSS